jgi:hypothetical protein
VVRSGISSTVFTGNAETTPLALMLKDNIPANALLDFIEAQRLMEVEMLSKTITKFYAQVAEKDTRDRKATIQKHNDKTHVRSPNFQVDDYVLVVEHRKSGVNVIVAGKVDGPAPHRKCGVRLCVCRGESAHEGAEGRAGNAPAILSG